DVRRVLLSTVGFFPPASPAWFWAVQSNRAGGGNAMSEAVDDVTHVREWDHNAEPPDPHAAGGAAIDLSAPGQFVISAENATRYRVVVVSEKADVSVDKLQQDP